MVYEYAFLIIILILMLVMYFLKAIQRPQNYPPGPSWLPIIGNMRDIKVLAQKLGGHHLALSQLSDKFKTKVLGLKTGGDLTIVVSSYETVRKVLIGEEYEGRPNNFFIRLRCMGVRRGITCVDGPIWTEQRNFVVRHLRNIGYGKKQMETMVLDEVENVLQLLGQKAQKDEIQLGPIFAPSVLNVLWSLATGSRFSRDDPRLTNFLKVLHTRSKAFDMAGGTMSQLPWLRYIIPEQIGYNLLVQLNQQLRQFFTQTIEEHHKSWFPDRQDDLIYSFITEMNNKQNDNFTDDQLIMICLDLFIAGATTTSTTLDFIFLAMLLNPDVQEKAAQCLLQNTDLDEPLNYSDRLKVPYIDAIIMEVERLHGVAPVIGPRRVLHDTILDGYNIPKETTVLINIHSVHFDKEFWGDPQVFRPERFINNEGKLILSERVLNFGLGKRRCLGELLARQCIFLFFAAILRKYKICQISGTDPPSTVPLPGLTLSPRPYKVNLEARNT